MSSEKTVLLSTSRKLERTGLKTPAKQTPKRLADADILYGILFHAKLRFKQLKLDTELPFVLNVLRQLPLKPEFPSPNPGAFAAMGSVSSLDLSIDRGRPYNDGHVLYSRLLKASRLSLRSLRIAFIPNAAVRKAQSERTIENVLSDIAFPELRTLNLELLPPTPPVVPLGKVASRWTPPEVKSERNQRSTCQELDICSFFIRHLDTLTSISFKNIVFSNSSAAPKRRNVHATTKEALKLLKTSSKLESLQWTVGRYTQDPRCKRDEGDSRAECSKFECGIYCSAPGQQSMVEDFDKLAKKLGVEVDEEMKGWDFGVVVREEMEIPEERDA